MTSSSSRESLDRLFAADHGDGGLDLVLLAPAPLEAAVLAKCLAHWLTGCAPLAAMSPALAIMLDLRLDAAAALVLSLALGTPTLCLLGAVGAMTSKKLSSRGVETAPGAPRRDLAASGGRATIRAARRVRPACPLTRPRAVGDGAFTIEFTPPLRRRLTNRGTAKI